MQFAREGQLQVQVVGSSTLGAAHLTAQGIVTKGGPHRQVTGFIVKAIPQLMLGHLHEQVSKLNTRGGRQLTV